MVDYSNFIFSHYCRCCLLFSQAHGDSARTYRCCYKGAITEKAEAIGYIKPRHSITIKSQVGGTVANIYHYEGEPIKKVRS